jgi:hypothetical protein
MDIISGTAGIKGLESIIWEIISSRTEKELKIYLKKLRKHVKLNKEGGVKIREYTQPENI